MISKEITKLPSVKWPAYVFFSCFFLLFGVSYGNESSDFEFARASTFQLARLTPDHDSIDIGLETNVEPEMQKELTFSLGLGAAGVPDYEGSDDYQAVPLVFARVDWPSGRYIELLGNRLSANVLSGENWSFGPMARYRSSRDDDVENEQVARMREVDAAAELGAFLKYTISGFYIGANGAYDVGDGHEGLLARLEIGYSRPVAGMLVLGIEAFTTYANDKYMEAYFSVDDDNALRSGLPVYDASGGMKDVGTALTIVFSPQNKWSLTGILGYSRLLGDAEDSPVVDEVGNPNQFIAGLMLGYRF